MTTSMSSAGRYLRVCDGRGERPDGCRSLGWPEPSRSDFSVFVEAGVWLTEDLVARSHAVNARARPRPLPACALGRRARVILVSRLVARPGAGGEKRDMSVPARPVLRSCSRHWDATHTTGTDRCHLHGTPRCPVPLAGQIFGPLLGEFAFAQAGGLADFDHVAVGVRM
jgi:hypothetical protein